MAIFPIAGLASHLLEKIITKMEAESYFRLQQTCHGMEKFIRKSRNISVQLDGIYNVKSEATPVPTGGGPGQHQKTSFRLISSKNKRGVDIGSLYGTRLAEIEFYNFVFITMRCDFRGYREAAEEFMGSLRENRITCEKLDLSQLKCTEEDCTTLLNILKPTNVKIADWVYYEALFQLKTLKFVTVYFSAGPGEKEEARIVNATRNFLSTCEKADLSVFCGLRTQPFHLLRTVLEILFSQASPKLRELKFDVEREGVLDAKDDFEMLFRDFNHTLEDETEGHFIARMELPQHFPPGSHCKMEVEYGEDVYATISFTRGQE